LLQNYPNPFNPGTTISYDIPEKTTVKLQIYDLLGRLVRTLVHAQQEAGSYAIPWDGLSEDRSSVGSGVYFYRLETDKHVAVRKMLLIR
jgi:flagellar hook assembly protein FlgD